MLQVVPSAVAIIKGMNGVDSFFLLVHYLCFSSNLVPNYRVFNTTFTELEIDAQLVLKLRPSLDLTIHVTGELVFFSKLNRNLTCQADHESIGFYTDVDGLFS